jgi:hypothetical protein
VFLPRLRYPAHYITISHSSLIANAASQSQTIL